MLIIFACCKVEFPCDSICSSSWLAAMWNFLVTYHVCLLLSPA
ncbi:hypothetical protein COLO4_32727 [Corchorus olitorius]|uniref:Uncharacterized protein n=1 Tax=Corchorus olitorius TaxID=93759 RepID=A0A1R3GYK2_9ROSI|nr:hypothetical protein COLO4_32727 [Corchorus olitorius]